MQQMTSFVSSATPLVDREARFMGGGSADPA